MSSVCFSNCLCKRPRALCLANSARELAFELYRARPSNCLKAAIFVVCEFVWQERLEREHKKLQERLQRARVISRLG